jgi:23S rRNA (cytidine1920-2'-O)/16S rRNA (cytidine1409-2'-O)-methyltransferase
MRLDVFLVKMGFFASRELAKFNISNGNVVVNGKTANKPSQEVTDSSVVTLKQSNVLPYVSRGGLKLHKALEEFGVHCRDYNVLDIGASTGGFTDCVLQHGAKLVYAVDVGTNQLADSLKSNAKVVSIENIHIKDLTPDRVNNLLFHLIVTDLSFISLTKVLEFFPKFLLPQGRVITLIKPQFEVGKPYIGKSGLAKAPKTHVKAIDNIFTTAQQLGIYPKSITYSPFVETNRNIEYLALFERSFCPLPNIEEVVKMAFNEMTSNKKS